MTSPTGKPKAVFIFPSQKSTKSSCVIWSVTVKSSFSIGIFMARIHIWDVEVLSTLHVGTRNPLLLWMAHERLILGTQVSRTCNVAVAEGVAPQKAIDRVKGAFCCQFIRGWSWIYFHAVLNQTMRIRAEMRGIKWNSHTNTKTQVSSAGNCVACSRCPQLVRTDAEKPGNPVIQR